ncbi:MAG: hypothetical protein FJ009_02190 [Chloroflexi bacterium]|nr:hypothetical protein [Chloroflexota bacterium]
MKSSTKIGVGLALLVGAIAAVATPEYSGAFPPAAHPTSTRTPAARHANDTTFTLYLPIIYKAPGPIYLPIIMRAPSPAPTNTPITPIPNPIQNWNFESGHTAWYETPAGEIITNNLAGKPAYSGSWAAWLGGEFDATHYLSQLVAIPVSARTLSFWYWIDSVEACGNYDNAWLYVGGVMLVEFDLCRNNNTGGWVRRAVDISAHAGQTRWVQFVAYLDRDTNSNFLVDDVVISSTVGAPAAARTPTPSR